MKRVLLILSLIACHLAFAQKSVENLFITRNLTGAQFDKILRKYTILDVDAATLRDLSNTSYDRLKVKIPFDAQHNIVLDLVTNKIFSGNLQATTTGRDGKHTYNYKPGKYYKGKLASAGESMAAASFFDDNIAIVFADSDGNVNVEKIKSSDRSIDGKYIIYREQYLNVRL